MLVDLYTIDRKLEDLILVGYPGLIFENMHKVDNTGEEKTYCFYDLDYRELLRFIGECKAREKYEFEVRDNNGEVIEVNRLK